MVVRYRLLSYGEKVFDADTCQFVEDKEVEERKKQAIRITETRTKSFDRKTSVFERFVQGKPKYEYWSQTSTVYKYYPIYIVEDNGNYFEPFTKTPFINNGWTYGEGECLTLPGVRKKEWVAYARYQYEGEGMYMGNCPSVDNKKLLELKDNVRYRTAVQAYIDALRQISGAEEAWEKRAEEERIRQQKEREALINNL